MKKCKLLTLLLLVFVAVMIFVSCGDSTVTTTSETTTAKQTTDGTTTAKVTTTVVTTTEVTTTAMFNLSGEYASAFPKASEPKELYIMTSPSSTSDLLSLVSLQGLLARNTDTRIIIEYSKSVTNFVNCIKLYHKDCKVSRLTSFNSAFKKHLDDIDGYILTDFNDDSINVATSLAGHLNAIVVTKQNENSVKSAGLTCLLDVTEKDDSWLRRSQYWKLMNKDYAFMVNPGNIENLRDYAIFLGAYVYTDDISTGIELTRRVDFLNDGFTVLGWNTKYGEYDVVQTLSALNGSILAADFAKNLSGYCGFSLNTATQSTAENESDGKGKHSVCIVISDGDNLQWCLNDFQSSTKWYANRSRGDYPIGWGLPASLIDVAPAALEYFYRTMEPTDEFIMQLSGLAYTFPSRWKNLEALAEMQKKLGDVMERADMSVMEILDNASLNQSVVDTYYSGFLAQDSIDGILYIDYSNYAGHGGKVYWSNDKPVVTARHRIWADFTDITSLANEINRASTNEKLTAAYSFIIVHAWSGIDSNGKVVANGNTVDAVTALVELLDEDVEVVTPTEFINRITENTPHR